MEKSLPHTLPNGFVVDYVSGFESGERRAALQRMSGWTVERSDDPEGGVTEWNAARINSVPESWVFLWFGRKLEVKEIHYSSWTDFWGVFKTMDPENVEPYSTLHPDFIGFFDYSAGDRGVCAIHLLARPQPTEEQLRGLLQVWKSLEAKGGVLPKRRT